LKKIAVKSCTQKSKMLQKVAI